MTIYYIFIIRPILNLWTLQITHDFRKCHSPIACSLPQLANLTMSHRKIAAVWTSIHVWDAYITLHIRFNFQNYSSTRSVFICWYLIEKYFTKSSLCLQQCSLLNTQKRQCFFISMHLDTMKWGLSNITISHS